MGTNSEGYNERGGESHETHEEIPDRDEQKLLETILRDTMGNSNSEILNLVFQVARASSHKDTSRIGAVEEFVRAIINRKFGSRRFPAGFINRVACSLIDVPEAAVKLERLWQEARASG